MIANVSPSSLSYEDTHNTLAYANRAKNIKTTVVRNVVNVDFHITKYKQIVADLRTEVDELKATLAKYERLGPNVAYDEDIFLSVAQVVCVVKLPHFCLIKATYVSLFI
jgi:hypothetical protein